MLHRLPRSPKAARRAANKRMARYRARQASPCIIAPVQVTVDVIGFLIDLHWLAMAESETRSRVGEAIGCLRDASAAFARSRDR